MSVGLSRACVVAAVGLAACGGPQNALDPHGPAAGAIAQLWWVMLSLATAVSAAVAAALLLAIRRSRRRARGEAVAEVNGSALVWGGGVVLPVAVLFPLLAYSLVVGTRVYPPPGGDGEALTVEVIGRQFWWEVRYPGEQVTTANEIRLPVGRPVRLRVSAPDVIHSLWIPQLQGKIDLIPGRVHTLWLRADTAGRFRGQCAEYCGMAHALMALWVVALPPGEFAAWVERRRAPAPEPDDPGVRRGRDVFFAAGCGQCHATRGAPLPPSLGQVGPDLTGLAGRLTLAAGTLPNTRGALGGWIADPQRIKPGSRMPPTRLPGGDLQALLTYLESLE